jgi:Uma2 family endonuclease
VATTALFTIDQLEALPDGDRFELIRGDLREEAPAGEDHSGIQAELIGRLYMYLNQHPGGKVYGDGGIVIEHDPDTVLAPDTAFVRKGRVPTSRKRRGFMTLIPDLVIEIVSPNDRMREIEEKVKLYLSAGVVEVWVVVPHRQRLLVYTDTKQVQKYDEGDVFENSEPLPGFRLLVADIFR